MVVVSIVQVVFAAAAMWFAARLAIGFGRDVAARPVPPGRRVLGREVTQFGAPSLTTRITNDIQQVQLLLVMVATMMIAAPLTMVIGTILAIREDTGLAMILLVAVPLEIIVLGLVIRRMVPSFEQMQGRIDRVNTVLREQITGVRVVRAFTREPEESRRFAGANDALTATSMRASRLMAATFPTVTLIVNLSGVAVLWIGADRVAGGSTEIGSLIAFLTYMMQILSAVMLATFMLSMIPRAGVAADAHRRGARHRNVGAPQRPARDAASARPEPSSSVAPRSATPAHSTRCSTTCRSTSPPVRRPRSSVRRVPARPRSSSSPPASWTRPPATC